MAEYLAKALDCGGGTQTKLANTPLGRLLVPLSIELNNMEIIFKEARVKQMKSLYEKEVAMYETELDAKGLGLVFDGCPICEKKYCMRDHRAF